MTENSKIPPAKKTIQDPPEYAASGTTWSGRGKAEDLPSQARVSVTGFGGGSESAASSTPKDERDGRMGTGNVSGDWLGGPQNGEEAPKEKKAPKGSLSGGGVDAQQGGGPDVS